MASSSQWERGWTVALVSTHFAASETDLTALVDAHAALLFRVAHSILRNPAEAEDVVQDTFLDALRTTVPTAGLEQRVAERLTARLANATEARNLNASTFAATNSPTVRSLFASTDGPAAPPYFAVILNAVKDPRIFLASPMRYALAAASLLAIVAARSLFALHAHHQLSAPHQASASILPLQPSAQNPGATASFEGAGLQSRSTTPIIHAPKPSALTNTQVSQGLSLGSHTPPTHSGFLTPPPADRDAIALAETLAPSRPDVGMNFDATLNEFTNGVRLRSKVEESSIGPSNTIAGVQEPVVRQTVLQGTSFLTPGKPVMLGSIDTPDSTHHFDIAVVLDPLK